MQRATLRAASILTITSSYCTGLTTILEGCATNSASPSTPAVNAPIAVQPPPAPSPPVRKSLTVDESDPNKMGWIQGFLPPPDRTICSDLASNMFPRMRYGYNHMRESVPTHVVWRGGGPISKLPHAECDIGGMLFTDPDGTRHMFAEALKLTYIDSILVMHKSRMICGRYFGALDAHTQYVAMSIMKPLVDTLAVMLVMGGKLDPAAPVTQRVPELKGTAYSDATVCQVMDMTVGVCCSENYVDPSADVWVYARAGGILPRSAGYKGPDNFYDCLTTPRKEGEHGMEFAYKTVNAETLTWTVRRALSKSLATLLFKYIW